MSGEQALDRVEARRHIATLRDEECLTLRQAAARVRAIYRFFAGPDAPNRGHPPAPV